jgi:serine/threonine protein phosphatase PrpC
VLACDGMWDVMSHEDAVKVLTFTDTLYNPNCALVVFSLLCKAQCVVQIAVSDHSVTLVL